MAFPTASRARISTSARITSRIPTRMTAPAFTAAVSALKPFLSLGPLRQQQRRAALQKTRERRRNVDRRDILLALKLLNELSENSTFTCRHRFGDALLEP